MSATTTRNPLSALPAVEAELIRSINSVASALEDVGTTALGAAMQRLQDAAEGAKARLHMAKADLYSTITSVVENLEAFSVGIMEDMSSDEWLPGNLHQPSPSTLPEPSTNGQHTVLVNRISAISQPEPIAPPSATSNPADDPVASIAANSPTEPSDFTLAPEPTAPQPDTPMSSTSTKGKRRRRS